MLQSFYSFEILKIMKLIFKGLILSFFILTFQGCKEKNQLEIDPIKINFSKEENENFNFKNEGAYPKNFKVAISAITSPREGLVYYKDLISFLEKDTNIPFKIVQRKTYQEVNMMLRNNEVNLAFICSGAYIDEKKVSDVEIIAVPVTNGKPFYKSYIIANKRSNINSFEEFKGHSFAFTDPLSNTGRLYALKRLKEMGYTEKDFFLKNIYSYGHDTSIQLVSKNVVDGASIDGLIYEYLKIYNPKRVENIKIIEKSIEFGIPPIVAPRNLDNKLKTKIKLSLLNMHKDSIGKIILGNLLIDKFVEGKDSNYNSIREMHNFVNE